MRIDAGMSAMNPDDWLQSACEYLTRPEHWSVSDLHRARMKWMLTHSRLGYTNGLRRLAWTAVLLNKHILVENKRPVLAMPLEIAKADVHLENIDAVIGVNRGQFVCMCEDERRKSVFECYVRSVGGGWNESRHAFALKWHPNSIRAIETLQRHGFNLTPQAEGALAELRDKVEEKTALSRAAGAEFHVPGLVGEPYPYQQAGIQYIATTKRVLIGDEMGLGKTLQALGGVQALQAWPAFVGTLASVKDGWVRECRKWLPHVDCYLYEGRTGKPRYFPAENPPEDGTRPALHVCNYDIIPHRLQELESINFQAVIYDEGHLLKNKKSKRTMAAAAIGHRKPVRLVLTGTPVENRPAELMTVLGLLGRMDDVGGFQYFTHHYLGAERKKVGKDKYIWTFGKPRHLPELHEKMRATFYLRRLCKDVDKERPASIITRVPITLPPAGKAAYDAAKADIKAWLAAKAPLRPEEAKRIEAAPPELREFVRGQVITEAAERLDGMELLQRLGVLRQVLATAKAPVVVEWLDHFAEDNKLVFFGHHRSAVRGLAPALTRHNPLIIDGDTPTNQRTDIVKQFTHDPERRILLANFIAAGTGLDGLQHAASHLVCAEWPWTPAKLRQAVARLERTGQKHTVHQWHLYVPGTVDDESLELLADKAENCDALIDGDGAQVQAEAFRRARRMVGNL